MRRQARYARRGRFAACLAAALSIAGSQALAQDVTIGPSLREGDQFRLDLVRLRDNSLQPQQNGRGRTAVDVTVVSVTADGVVLDWGPGETTLDNQQLAQNPLLAAAVQAASGLRFRLTLNPDGELTGMANQAEVAPKLQAIVDAVLQALAEKLPAEQRQAMIGFASQILSPEVLIASAMREAALYFGLNGVSLAAGEEAETEIEQPSPFGGAAIPATFRVRMDSVTAESASLTTATTYDSGALVRLTASLAEQAGKPIPPDQLAKIPPIEMSEEGRYVFDRTVGLMREVIVTRRVGAGNSRRSDGWEIRLVDSPRR